MYQILRSSKSETHLLSRHYGNQRKNRTHYEILQIPETSSQKEIREAFIKLSKEMHPDVKGKSGHAEFVKINEAYKVLSKEHSKRGYDMNLKSGYSTRAPYYSPSYTVYRSNRQHGGYEYSNRSSHFTNTKEWEEYVNSQANSYYYGIRGVKRLKNMWIVFILVTVTTISSIIQIIAINKRILDNRELNTLRSKKYEDELNRIRKNSLSKTEEERIEDFMDKVNKEEETSRKKVD